MSQNSDFGLTFFSHVKNRVTFCHFSKYKFLDFRKEILGPKSKF